jgi:serine/threonine protein kinase
VRTVAVRTLHALAYLHDVLGVCHRDVKHQNIFLQRSGDVRTAVLGDLGHARSLETGEEASTLGSMLGTFLFNPPEMQENAPGPHTRRVDIYQMGATLYVLIVGCGPNRLDEVVDVLANASFFTNPDAIAAWEAAAAADGPAGAARAACVRRMLAHNPADRGSAMDNLTDPWVAGAV